MCRIHMAIAVVFCVAVVARAEETLLNYRVTRNIISEVGAMQADLLSAEDSRAQWRLTTRLPRDAKNLPPLVAAKPYFARVLERPLILDKSRPESDTWDVLWFDTNGNGTYEPGEKLPVSISFGGRGGSRVLLPAEVPARDGPGMRYFLLTFSNERPFDYAWFAIQSADYFFGDVKFGEKTYRVAIVDRNANGRFDDESSTTPGDVGDILLIDLNGDGRFAGGSDRADEVFYVGKYLYLDGIYWGLSIPAEGGSIIITRPEK